MKKLLFIFNPYAGKAKIKKHLYEIIEYYATAGYLVTVYPTNDKGDAYTFIKHLELIYDLLVCAGGDGTMNEVVSGLLDNGLNTCLGYIPAGSTNDFGRSVGLSNDLNTALKITTHGSEINLDVGQFNEKKFIYVAAFGVFSRVPYETSQKMKNLLGYIAYFLEGIKSLSELKIYNMHIKYDMGSLSGSFVVGLITNSFSVAGFKNPTYALTDLNDGLFEVLLIRVPENVIQLKNIVSEVICQNLNTKYITFIQTNCLEINSDPIEWTFDGEYGGTYTVAHVTNMCSALKVKGNKII